MISAHCLIAARSVTWCSALVAVNFTHTKLSLLVSTNSTDDNFMCVYVGGMLGVGLVSVNKFIVLYTLSWAKFVLSEGI